VISRYYLDSIVPSWLAADTGYITAFTGHLLDRMRFHGYTPVAWPTVSEAPSKVPAPVGMVIIRATIDVEEFDIDMADDLADEPS